MGIKKLSEYNTPLDLYCSQKKETNAARRWLPWLAALSGARIGELAQLWGEEIKIGSSRILVGRFWVGFTILAGRM